MWQMQQSYLLLAGAMAAVNPSQQENVALTNHKVQWNPTPTYPTISNHIPTPTYPTTTYPTTISNHHLSNHYPNSILMRFIVFFCCASVSISYVCNVSHIQTFHISKLWSVPSSLDKWGSTVQKKGVKSNKKKLVKCVCLTIMVKSNTSR